jgi:hypothetical protein
MKDYKNLTDQELLDIIDTKDVTNLEDLKELAKTDSDFQQRLRDLKKKNKDLSISSGNEIISLLEQAILTASDEAKPQLQQSLDNLKKIVEAHLNLPD